MGAGLDGQVLRRIGQVGFGRAPTPAVGRCCLVIAASFLLGAIEVGVGWNPGLLAGRQNGLGEFALRGLIGDMERAAGAMVFVSAAGLVLGFFEVGQDGVPVPAGAASLAPVVIVGVIPTYIHHAIDRAGPTERFAAREVEAAVVHLWLGLGLEFP